MPNAMVAFNGRITLPTQVRKQLGLKTGDDVEFVEVGQGRFAISCRHKSASDMDLRQVGPELVPAIDEIEKVAQ